MNNFCQNQISSELNRHFPLHTKRPKHSNSIISPWFHCTLCSLNPQIDTRVFRLRFPLFKTKSCLCPLSPFYPQRCFWDICKRRRFIIRSSKNFETISSLSKHKSAFLQLSWFVQRFVSFAKSNPVCLNCAAWFVRPCSLHKMNAFHQKKQAHLHTSLKTLASLSAIRQGV